MKNSSLAAVFLILPLVVSTLAARPAPSTPRWTEVAPGVWKTTVGESDLFTLTSAAGGTPSLKALSRMPGAAFPLEATEIEARNFNGKTAVRFPLDGNEDIYGLGLDFSGMRRNGGVFELHMDHWDAQRAITGRTHAPVPLYVSSKGFAVLFDTARYLKVTVGHGVRLTSPRKPPVIDRTSGRIVVPGDGEMPVKARWEAHPRSDSIEVLANAPGMDIYVFAGPGPLDAVCRYNLYSGGGALPPKWGLGFLNRFPTRHTASEVLADIGEFKKYGIPLDMIGLEPGWMDHAYPCSFEWDRTRFPDPKGFLDHLAAAGIRANLWFNPYIGSPSTPLYKKMLPFAGTHLVWNGLVPDFTLPEAQSVLADHLKRTVLDLNPSAIGGFKIDEVDGFDQYLWPDVALFPSGRDGEQLRQTYGLLVQKTVFDLFHKTNRRTMGQIRGTNAGASPYPFVLYNDNYEFGGYITALSNSGFAGVLWSPEVRGSDSGEDMLRRIQAVCFSPLAVYNGWASPHKLWSHPGVRDHIRDAILLRGRLLPYFYHTFARYHYEGVPPVRPMPLCADIAAEARTGEPGKLDATNNPYEVPMAAREVKDQFLFGDALLVAPIPPGEKTRKVLLPGGKWYDFHTGKLAGANTTIDVSPPLATIPVFVKDGALIPMIEPRLRAPAAGEKTSIEIRHYGESTGRLSLYDDDGETFNHEKGECSWTGLTVERNADGSWFGTVIPDAQGRKWSYGEVKWTFMSAGEH